jgi:hypothetical protein
MRVEYNINKVQDTSYPLAQYGLLDVHSPVAPGLTPARAKHEKFYIHFTMLEFAPNMISCISVTTYFYVYLAGALI